MPGDDDGLTPDAAPAGGSDEHTRIADKKKWSDVPEPDGLPDDENLDATDAEERLDDDPERETNRRDVPPGPENTIEARTQDGAEDEITRP